MEASAPASAEPSRDPGDGYQPGHGHCWNKIGVTGDRTCPELESVVHCRNCPAFAAAARTFFDRMAPDGYLAEWSKWLAGSIERNLGDEEKGQGANEARSQERKVSVLIFRLGPEWLAFRTQSVAEVTIPRPVHRIPHRSNEILRGVVNLQGQVELCVSLHGLLGVTAPAAPARLIVLRDCERMESWAFAADEVLGVHHVARDRWRSVPSTLVNPTVGFSQAVLSWQERCVGVLDEQRVFTALRSLRP